MFLRRKNRRDSGKKLGLTTLLISLITLAVVMTSAILVLASYKTRKQSLIETTLNLNYANASRLSQTAEALFKSMHSSLEYSAAELTSPDKPSPDEVDTYLEWMRQSGSYFNSVAVVDENSVIRHLAPLSPGAVGKTFRTQQVQEAIAAKKAYISQPYITETTHRLIMFMSQPLFDAQGLYIGVVGGTIYLLEDNMFNMIFGNNEVDESGSYYYVVDSGGHLLYHPDKSRIGEDISNNEVVQQLMKGKSGEREIINKKGGNMLAGYAIVPSSGWGIVAVSPVSVMHKQLVSHLLRTLWYTLLPFAFLLIFVIVVARKLASPFVYLADLVSKIGKKPIIIPAERPHWNREADLLTKTVFSALSEMQKQTDRLTRHAMTDPLTGLTNRRSLELTMAEWIAAEVPFSLIVMDVDKFKFVNDTYGHLTGDEVLKHVAGIIVSSVRPGDVSCRYGGEEFVILLSRTQVEDAYVVAERIRRTLETSEAPTTLPITVSQGIAHYPAHGKDGETLMNQADQALYYAKNTGRNRTIIAGTQREGR